MEHCLNCGKPCESTDRDDLCSTCAAITIDTGEKMTTTTTTYMLTDLQACAVEDLPRDTGVEVIVHGDLDDMGMNTVDLEGSSRQALIEYVRDNWGDEDMHWFYEYVESRVVEIDGRIPVSDVRYEQMLNLMVESFGGNAFVNDELFSSLVNACGSALNLVVKVTS